MYSTYHVMAASQIESHSSTFRKLALSFGLIIISAVYALLQNSSGGQSIAVGSTQATPSQSYKTANKALLQTLSQIDNSAPVTTPSAPVSTTNNLTSKITSVPTPAPKKPSGQYINGSYTGSPANAYYGAVQVEAIVRNGQLADIKFLQYPNSHSTSVFINQQAMPYLIQEAIQSQNANIDGVSGATFTSQAFVQSLTSALVQAKA